MPFSTKIHFQISQCTSPSIPGVPFTSIPHNTLSKSMVSFQHSHQDNDQLLEGNESCHKDYS